MDDNQRLTRGQILGLLALAISFWASGVGLIRLISSLELWGGTGSAIIFVLSIPVAWLCIVSVRRLVGLAPAQVLTGTALITAVVTLLDGVALTWWPALYGFPSLLAAAWLLWFAGAVMGVAVMRAA